MPKGVVVRSLAGFFDVAAATERVRCRARGVFRQHKTTVLVGDRVVFDRVGPREGIIRNVLPRTTELVRPPVANVDLALLVFSAAEPAFLAHLLDRLLVSVAVAGLEPLIVITKTDLAPQEDVADIVRIYGSAGFEAIALAWPVEHKVESVRARLLGHLSVLAGPSGVGKSTLANALSPELGAKVGEVSDKAGRGKHTTRHVELFELAPDTFIVDAPGFSSLELSLPAADVRLHFPEFRERARACPYRSCLHMEEQECAIKTAVDRGEIANSRYASYRAMVAELREKEAHRY